MTDSTLQTTGTITTDGSPQFDHVKATVFINKGPFFDGLDPKKFYANVLGSPMSFEIHQSINGLFRYGYLVFEDRVGVREALPLTGNEILTIQYQNSSKGITYAEKPKVIHFNVYDIKETQTDANAKGDRFSNKAIRFHVIEAPFFLKYNTTIVQSAYGTPSNPMLLHTIINQLLTQELNITNSLFSLNIEKMTTAMHFISPSWRAQNVFNYLLQYARDENGYGNVKFYTTSDPLTGQVIINLQSVNQMYSTNNAVEYSFVDVSPYLSGLPPSTSLITPRTINQILSYNFISYDLTALASGLPGAHLLNVDYVNSQYYTLNDNYQQNISRKENPYFYNYALWSSTISNDQSKRLFLGSLPTALAQGYLSNQIIQHQYQLRCETMTYIDETINPGDKILVFFMSGMATIGDQQHLLDEQMSGAWIIEEIVDSVVNGVGFRKMTLIKDSFLNIYDVTTGSANSKTLPMTHTVFSDTLT